MANGTESIEQSDKEALPPPGRESGKPKRAYDPSFAEEVFANVDSGEEIKLCMQCGICSGSCPFKYQMIYSPRRIFNLIRAGEREKVLTCPDIMLCTSCYSCMVRCPRGIRVMDVMHGLANYALSQGFEPRHESAVFGDKFWKSIYKLGRVDEKDVAMKYALGDGLLTGIKKGLELQDIGLAQVLHRRLNILPVRKIKGAKSLKKMLDRAREISRGGEA